MERDDIIEYSLDAHHSEETGKKIRKKILKVTLIMTVITIVEVGIGMYGLNRVSMSPAAWMWIKLLYIVLTVVKAAYIVMSFMHLGDERKSFKWTILAPYIGFILYLIFICLTESTYIHHLLGY